jgi:hypothetical protein
LQATRIVLGLAGSQFSSGCIFVKSARLPCYLNYEGERLKKNLPKRYKKGETTMGWLSVNIR